MVLDDHTIILKDIENYFLYESEPKKSVDKDLIISIFRENYRDLNNDSLIYEMNYREILGLLRKLEMRIICLIN